MHQMPLHNVPSQVTKLALSHKIKGWWLAPREGALAANVCRLPALMHRSPFMRNVEVVIALLFGYMVAYVCKQRGNRFVDTSNLSSAPNIT